MTIIKEIENWFKAAVPKPTDDNRRVQLGCHLEEVGEMCEVIKITDETTRYATNKKTRVIDRDTYTGTLIDHFDIVGVDALPKRIKKGYYDHTLKTPIRMIYTVSIADKTAFTDSLADQIVTAIGLAYMNGIDLEGALNEVNRSNWSKFVDGKPVFDENGKIKKSDGYTPPDLSEFVGG